MRKKRRLALQAQWPWAFAMLRLRTNVTAKNADAATPSASAARAPPGRSAGRSGALTASRGAGASSRARAAPRPRTPPRRAPPRCRGSGGSRREARPGGLREVLRARGEPRGGPDVLEQADGAAGREDAPNLGERARRVVHAAEDEAGEDGVERAVPERERLGARAHERHVRGAAPRGGERLGRRVDADRGRAGREERQVPPGAAAEVEGPAPPRRGRARRASARARCARSATSRRRTARGSARSPLIVNRRTPLPAAGRGARSARPARGAPGGCPAPRAGRRGAPRSGRRCGPSRSGAR